MVSVHRPVHSKITLTYSLTWQTDHYTPRRMAFKKCQGQGLLKPFKDLFFKKPYQNGLLLQHGCVYCRLRNYVCEHLNNQPTLNYYLLSTLYVTHVINYCPLPLFRTANDGKLGGAWEQGQCTTAYSNWCIGQSSILLHLLLQQDQYLPPPFPIQLPVFKEMVMFGAEMKEKHFFIDVRIHQPHFQTVITCRTVKQEMAWFLVSFEWRQDRKDSRKGLMRPVCSENFFYFTSCLCEERYQALSHLTILQATESWAGACE